MKDKRYTAIKSLIENKSFHSLKDVFEIVPISTVKDDLKVNYNTLRNRINNSDTLTIKDLRGMAELFEVEAAEILRLALMDIKSKTTKSSLTGKHLKKRS